MNIIVSMVSSFFYIDTFGCVYRVNICVYLLLILVFLSRSFDYRLISESRIFFDDARDGSLSRYFVFHVSFFLCVLYAVEMS